MSKHYFLFNFALYLLSFNFCIAQNSTIKGKVDASYLKNATHIYAFTYEDYISFKEKQLASNALDPQGNFTLTIPNKQATYLFLTIDNAKAELVVEPGKTYDITIFRKDSDAVNMLSMSVPVEIQFNNSDSAELNYLIADFTNRYEAFLEYHHPLIAKKNPVIFGKIDTMQMLCKAKYAKYRNDYLNNHITYTFATLEESITLKMKEKILQKYISPKPILLNNYDYMTFFNQFFSVTTNYFMSTGATLTEINTKQSFSSLMSYFKQSKLLSNDTIRETVVLKSLSEYYRYPDLKVNGVIAILTQASKECKLESNRKAAENLIKKASVMNIGKTAPTMTFLDLEGKEVSLADFKGKYIYLNFWGSWCASCTQEMTLIPDLKKQYGGKIIFISISIDKRLEDMKNFVKKNPKLDPDKNGSGWIFLYCDSYKKAKEEFRVLTVPAYYLIDPKGNVLKAPAANPIEIEPTLMEIKKRR